MSDAGIENDVESDRKYRKQFETRAPLIPWHTGESDYT